MNQPPFRSLQFLIATRPNSTHRRTYSNQNLVSFPDRNKFSAVGNSALARLSIRRASSSHSPLATSHCISNQPVFRKLQTARPPFRRDVQTTDHESHVVTNHDSRIANGCSPRAPFLIGSSAIRNARNSLAINAQSISNRSKNACLHARFSHVSRTNHQPHRAIDATLIASRQLLEFRLTCSQQTRKLFLIASFSACLARASQRVSRSARITNHTLPATNHYSPITNHYSPITNHHRLHRRP